MSELIIEKIQYIIRKAYNKYTMKSRANWDTWSGWCAGCSVLQGSPVKMGYEQRLGGRVKLNQRYAGKCIAGKGIANVKL